MSLIQIVETSLAKKYLVPDQSKMIEANIMDIKIRNYKHYDYRLYKFADGGHEIYPFFEGRLNLRRMCDYIMFVEHKNRLKVFNIELKHGKEHSAAQLEASVRFVNFLFNCITEVRSHVLDIEVYTVRISRKSMGQKMKSKSGICPAGVEFDKKHCNYRLNSFCVESIIDASN